MPVLLDAEATDSLGIGSEAYYLHLDTLFIDNNINELDYWLQKGEKEGNLRHDTLLLIKVYQAYARKHFNARELETSISYLNTAYELAKHYGDQSAITKSLILLATMNSYSGNDSLALQLFLKVEELNKQAKNQGKDFINSLYVNLALTYRKVKNYDKSMEYFNKSREFIDTNNLNQYAIYQLNIANLYADMKNYPSAQYHGTQALLMKKKVGDQAGIARSLMTLGFIYSEAKKPYMATSYYEEALEYGKILQSPTLLRDAYKELAINYEILNKYQYSLEMYKKYHTLLDSISNSQMLREISKLKSVSELKEKNLHLRKEAENRKAIESTLETQKNINYILFALVAISFLLLAFIVQLYRQKEKYAALLIQRNAEYQAMNVKLSNSNAAKDKFMSILAHDMINPFNAFLGLTQFIQRSFDDLEKDEIKDSIKDIAESANGLFALLENLLKWGRSQTGRINFTPEYYELNMLVLSTISVLKNNAQAKQITLVADVPTDIKVYADPNMLTTVIRNLISNAIKFTPKEGKISVEAYQSNSITTVTVTDTGMGIAESDMKKLFNLGSHHSTLGTSNEKGTGLGLILCKDFIDKHNGKIWVESQKGKGSIFTFTIPDKH